MSPEEVEEPDLGPLKRVELVGLPVPLWERAQQHQEELQREFALIAHDPDSGHLPAQVINLVAELRERFAAFAAAPTTELDDAARRGEESIDLTFEVPAAVRPAVDELEELLDEADEYCRAGTLLTLATPDTLVTFRRWYLDQFRAQIDGYGLTPWPDWKPANDS